MKKVLLSLGLFLVGSTSMYAAVRHVTINTSCGVSVDMVYQDNHTVGDIVNDTLILEEYFCG